VLRPLPNCLQYLHIRKKSSEKLCSVDTLAKKYKKIQKNKDGNTLTKGFFMKFPRSLVGESMYAMQ
jgi:hypothetical protein